MAFIAVAIVGPLIGVRLLDAASNAQVRLANARADLDALLRIQLSEETGLRGYAATGDKYFLEPDGPPNADFDREASALERRLRADRLNGAADVIAKLRETHDLWERQVALPLLRDPHSADADPRQTYGKLLTDQMRGESAALRAQLTVAGDRVQVMLRREIDTTVAISVGVVTIFAIVALWYAVGRAQAVARLAQERTLVDALQRTLRVRGNGLPRTRMGFAYASATREALVGGDLLDAWTTGPESGWFLIADASGKGIEAARHSAFAQYALRALVDDAEDPGEVLERFNRLFLNTFEDPTIFMVLFLAVFDARTQVLRYASAGHGTAYVRRGAMIERLPPTGMLIGINHDEAYGTETVPLAVGDLVLLATDGLTEARDTSGELLGEERVAAVLAEGPSDPQALCDRLVDVANAHSGGVQDDLAIVTLRVMHDGESAQASSFGALESRSGL